MRELLDRLESITAPESGYPVLAYRVGRDRRNSWVTHLPGQEGKDWGYDYDQKKAIPLSKRQAQRFAKRCRDVDVKCGFVPAKGAR